jgi:transposase
MNKVTTIGLDLAKNVFHAVCCDNRGKVVRRKMLRRSQVLVYFVNLPSCLVGMEACASAHYWARELEALGHNKRRQQEKTGREDRKRRQEEKTGHPSIDIHNNENKLNSQHHFKEEEQ